MFPVQRASVRLADAYGMIKVCRAKFWHVSGAIRFTLNRGLTKQKQRNAKKKTNVKKV